MRLEERNKNTKIEKDIIIHYIKEKKNSQRKWIFLSSLFL